MRFGLALMARWWRCCDPHLACSFLFFVTMNTYVSVKFSNALRRRRTCAFQPTTKITHDDDSKNECYYQQNDGNYSCNNNERPHGIHLLTQLTLTKCCERLVDSSELRLSSWIARISRVHNNSDKLEWHLLQRWRQQRRLVTNLVDKVNKCTDTAGHKSGHHPLVLMSCSQMAFHKQDNRQWKCCTCDIILPVTGVEHKPNELYRETDPEKYVELDQALKHLIAGVHLLNPAVGTKELVYLPTELVVDFPGETDVYQFGDGNDDGDGCG